jgi:5-formyltetrahydrofolate cyclo-ligase
MLAPMRKPLEPGDVGWRRAQRRRLIAARLAMAPTVREAASRKIEAALETRFPPGIEPLVGAYWPIQGEFDPLPYLGRCLEAGAQAALPAAASPGSPLEYRPWTPATEMQSGRWDILHPAEGPAVTPSVLLVPLLGFDAQGHRLGYGGGFFDRTLEVLRPRPIAVGLGFEAGRLQTLSPLAHDEPMNVIITEAGVFDFTR